jgi:hypothetical protein
MAERNDKPLPPMAERNDKASTSSPPASSSSSYSSSAPKIFFVAGLSLARLPSSIIGGRFLSYLPPHYRRQLPSSLAALVGCCATCLVAALVPRYVAAAPLLKTHMSARRASDNKGGAAALASVTRVTLPVPPHFCCSIKERKVAADECDYTASSTCKLTCIQCEWLSREKCKLSS